MELQCPPFSRQKHSTAPLPWWGWGSYCPERNSAACAFGQVCPKPEVFPLLSCLCCIFKTRFKLHGFHVPKTFGKLTDCTKHISVSVLDIGIWHPVCNNSHSSNTSRCHLPSTCRVPGGRCSARCGVVYLLAQPSEAGFTLPRS